MKVEDRHKKLLQIVLVKQSSSKLQLLVFYYFVADSSKQPS